MNTILVIDDNEVYRGSLVETLQFESYNVLEAPNGQIGLQMIHQHSPNLIVCDVDMPVVNGLEVLRMIKADPTTAKIPFVITTGRTDELTIKTARDLGAERYLTKPITVVEFLATIVLFLSTDVQTQGLW